MVLFKGNKSTQEIKICLAEFWQIAYKAVGNQHLQFTEEIRRKNTHIPPSANKEKVQIVANNKLPFLDTKLSWSPEGDLQFGVFRNKVHKWEYLSKEGNHTPITLYAIPKEVLNPLEKLTFAKTQFSFWKVGKCLPWPHNVPPRGGISGYNLPTMGEL